MKSEAIRVAFSSKALVAFCAFALATSWVGCDNAEPIVPEPPSLSELLEGTFVQAVEVPYEVPLPAVLGTTVLEDINPDPNIVEVELVARHETVELWPGFELSLMTYNGVIPGPVLHVRRGDQVIVHFTNELNEPTTVHWHGLRIPDYMDGSPRIQDPVQPGETFVYEFVPPDAGSYWYHPHINTNEQTEKGLYGTIIVREPDGEAPGYDAERFFTVDDILIINDAIPPFMMSNMEGMHGRNGNVLLTNGWGEPVEASAKQGHVERWRLVNTANARTMVLTVDGASWRVIGVDGGLLREPYKAEYLEMGVGQRYDVEVSYDSPGLVQLTSHIPALYENEELIWVGYEIVKIDVEETGNAPSEVIWPELEPLPERPYNKDVWIEFDAKNTAQGLKWMMNNMSNPEEPLFMFNQGDTVKMKLYNRAAPGHPFHLHGQFFEIIARNGKLVDEPGLRDTVLVPGNKSVQILAYMDNPGMWMAHCHILEHAKLGMMAEIYVSPVASVPAPGEALSGADRSR